MASEQTDRFCLRFPFELEPNRDLTGLEGAFSQEFKTFTVRLERCRRLYVLTICGFESPEDAEAFIPSVWAGLMGAVLNGRFAFRAVIDTRKVVFAADPVQAGKNLARSFGSEDSQPIHGIADGNAPCVYPENKQIRFATVGSGNARGSNPVEQFFEAFTVGLTATNAQHAFSDVRLRTALELYNAHFTEISRHAKFVTLVMAIECLTIKEEKHASALYFIAKWKAEIEGCITEYDPESEEHFALTCLLRELLFRRESSIRSGVRSLVMQTLAQSAPEEAASLAKRAVEIYDMRGKLVHEGALRTQDLAEGYTDARNIVERLLRSKIGIGQ